MREEDYLHTPGTALAAYTGVPETEVPFLLKGYFNNFMETSYVSRRSIIKFTPWDEGYRLLHRTNYKREFIALKVCLERRGWMVKLTSKNYETLATFILCSKQAPWWTKLRWFFTL